MSNHKAIAAVCSAIIVFLVHLPCSSEVSPGVSETTLQFATIITDDVRPEDRDAMPAPLEYYIRNRNIQTQANSGRAQSGSGRAVGESVSRSRELAGLILSLSRWTLKGPPETWRSQLEEYYSKEPVFAMIGGITRGDWKPIHEFSETQTDWYTLYLSKGYYQEGEGVARYLNRMNDMLKSKVIVQNGATNKQPKAAGQC